MRRLRAPLLLVAARARRRPGRWLMPVLGIAIAVAFAAGVAAEGVIAGDQGARETLSSFSSLDRTVRVTWQGPVTPGVAQRALGALHGLGLGPETEVTLLNPVRLSGVVVRPAAITPLGRWLPGVRSAPCRASACPVVLAGAAKVPSNLSAAGAHLEVTRTEQLRSAVPLAFAPGSAGNWPVVITGDVNGLNALAGLSGVYRTHAWLAGLETSRLHSWQLAELERRLSQAQARLDVSAGQFAFSAPFDGIAAARSQASAAPKRLMLIGGGALAGLLLFLVLAAAGLRVEQRAELERLQRAGARLGQSLVFVVGEAAWVCAIGLLAGIATGVGVAALLASAAGEPAGGVLAHSLLTWTALLAVLGGWLAATALIAVVTLARSERLLDQLAVAGASALITGVAVGSSEGGGWSLLLAPLCCLAGAVVVFRLARPALQGLERVARRGPALARLAIVGLARAPALPSLAIAFVSVSVGLGGFALAYRATLTRGAADQAAARVPLEALVSAGDSPAMPLELAPLSRWQTLAHGSVQPVLSTSASYALGGSDASVPALGVPASALPLIHGWRASDSALSPASLADRLRPSAPVRTPGPLLDNAARSLWVGVDSPAIAVVLTAELRDAAGSVRALPLGSAGPRYTELRALLPPGRWELQAIELTEPSGLEATNGHQNAENPAATTQFAAEVKLGPVRELGARGGALASVDLGRWRGVGAAGAARSSASQSLELRFEANGFPGVVRPAQPSDSTPVPVLTDPQTAAAAGPGGRIAMTIDALPVLAHVVGVVQRFPTVMPGAQGFVVADQATLSAALDAQLPGQGVPNQLWIGSSHLGLLRAALRAGPLAQLGALFRADLEHQLLSSPIARGVLHTLVAAAALSAALALLGMVLALSGAFRDRSAERDLIEQGVGPRALRSELRARFGLASAVGAITGFGIAVVLTILAVAAVGGAIGDSHPQPPLVTVVPWGRLALWALAVFAALALAGWLATALVIRNQRSRSGRHPGTRGENERLEEVAAG